MLSWRLKASFRPRPVFFGRRIVTAPHHRHASFSTHHSVQSTSSSTSLRFCSLLKATHVSLSTRGAPRPNSIPWASCARGVRPYLLATATSPHRLASPRLAPGHPYHTIPYHTYLVGTHHTPHTLESLRRRFHRTSKIIFSRFRLASGTARHLPRKKPTVSLSLQAPSAFTASTPPPVWQSPSAFPSSHSQPTRLVGIPVLAYWYRSSTPRIFEISCNHLPSFSVRFCFGGVAALAQLHHHCIVRAHFTQPHRTTNPRPDHPHAIVD